MPETAVFDHYEVLRRDDGSLFELGRGAMGITYKAFDTNLRCHVALKVINAASIDSDVARQRFVREARAAAQLRHRHVASVFHLGVEGDTYFYAMEFIDGETVESLIRRAGPLDPVLALRITMQVSRALNAATKHQLVHRDIKPSNLMLVREDEELVVKVIDFGLAKSSKKEDEETTAMLSMGGFVGTPHFASPEQLEEKEIDVRSDIYSLGVTLWYMLAGGAPFVGTLAQVMSDHLHKPPPFEKIRHVPEPVHKVLRHMLEKDAARRPQTPADLRKELEDCISILTGGKAERAVAIAPEVELVPGAGEPGERDIVRRTFYTGAIIAGRYEVAEDLGEGNAGWSFRAKDKQQQREVRLMVLHSQWAETPDALTQIEREVERIQGVQHPNLVRVFGVERVEDSSFVVLEHTNGFSLLEVLRARQELTVEEALPLLQQAATGVDFAINRGLKRLDIALHQIAIDFPNAPRPVAPLLEQRVTQWPINWTLKLNALGITRELAMSDTWAGGQTIVGGIEPVGRELSGANLSGRYVQALAAIAYELLGGTLSPLVLGGAGAQPAPRYVPLATLSEYGNEVLKQALDPARSFGSALEFCRTLKEAASEEIARHDTTIAPSPRVPVTPPRGQPLGREPKAEPQQPQPRPQQQPHPHEPVRVRSWWELPAMQIGGLAAVALAGAVIAFLVHRPRGKELQPVAGSELVSPTPAETNTAATPAVSHTPPFSPAPIAVSPRPDPTASLGLGKVMVPSIVAPSAAPSAVPDRKDILKARVEEAEKYETVPDWPRCIAAYAAIAREFPEVDIGRVRLQMVITSLRGTLEKMGEDEWTRYVGPITEAARLDVVPAMMILGEHLRKTATGDAFNWFCAAAARGDSLAMAQVGLFYSNGAPPTVERDMAKAAWWFQQSTEKGNAAGKLLLAECYLDGIGVPQKDEPKAVALLRESAEDGDPRAMNLLGSCYHHGRGTAQNFAEALRLFKKASDMGFDDATGNLGVLYINGEGVPTKNERKAVELFRKGAANGNALCMFFLARCLETAKGVDKNELEAERWYQKSAAAGNRLAIEWCQKHGIPVPK